jgi:hypothetical protein
MKKHITTAEKRRQAAKQRLAQIDGAQATLARVAYSEQLDLVRFQIDKLIQAQIDIVGDGMLNFAIDFAMVGDLEHLNEQLKEAAKTMQAAAARAKFNRQHKPR